MSARTMSATASAAIALCALFGAPSVVAQSMPNITAPKTAANNAAAATNEHIRAEQNPEQTPAKPAAPPAPATARQATPPPAPKPGTAPAKAPPPPAPGAAPVKGQAAVATATPAKGQAAAPAKGQPVAAGKGAGAAAAPDQANSVSQRGGKSEISLLRETFTYQSENRRDPFLSLMRTGDLRPMVSDLRLVAVIYDPAGRSVAILRDLQTKEQYRVKVGQTLGRMRVNQIRPQQVIFTIEEIGMTRQEALAMNDVTKARTQ
jgi:hypothetical protein